MYSKYNYPPYPNLDSISRSQDMNPLLLATMSLSLPNDKLIALGSRIHMGTGMNEDKQKIDDILIGTAIKRACCMGVEHVTVKIPTPAGTDPDTLSEEEKKFGYMNKTINVPQNICKSSFSEYIPNTSVCDNFMEVYCANVKNDYINLNSEFNGAGFSNYSPECSCYGNKIPEFESSRYNYPPKAYMYGCESGRAYQDPFSRSSDITIVDCSAHVELSNLIAGSGINMGDIKPTQNCSANFTSAEDASSNNTIIKDIDPSNIDPYNELDSQTNTASIDRAKSTDPAKNEQVDNANISNNRQKNELGDTDTIGDKNTANKSATDTTKSTQKSTKIYENKFTIGAIIGGFSLSVSSIIMLIFCSLIIILLMRKK